MLMWLMTTLDISESPLPVPPVAVCPVRRAASLRSVSILPFQTKRIHGGDGREPAAHPSAGGSSAAAVLHAANAEIAARRARRRRAVLRYRFTVKLLALLTPPAVVTVTLTVPYLALAGTLHLICVAFQEG